LGTTQVFMFAGESAGLAGLAQARPEAVDRSDPTAPEIS
jgi:hypothetical protein